MIKLSSRYLWYSFLAPGVLLSAWATVDGVQTWNVQRSIGQAKGTVLRILGTGKMGLDFYAEVEFAAADGLKHTFSTQMNYVNALRPGGKVTVAYDLDDPDHARVEMRPQNPWSGTIELAVWGSMFALIGGIPLYFLARGAAQTEWLQLNGRCVQAEFAGVHLDTNLIVNGKSPYRISAHWMDPATKQDYNFKSDNLWSDPTAHIQSHVQSHVQSKTIEVMLDPKNPKRYWMNLSFLPHSTN